MPGTVFRAQFASYMHSLFHAHAMSNKTGAIQEVAGHCFNVPVKQADSAL